MATFSHRNYTLQGEDRIVRNAGAPELTMIEEGEVYDEMARFVEAKIMSNYGFSPIQIPPSTSDEVVASTSILVSPDWVSATKILIIVQNQSGAQLGLFSRSLCLEQGLSKGSMLPYIERAVQEGYAVVVLRPNTNSILVQKVEGARPEKIIIRGSESPEIHALCVWENVIPLATRCSHIALLGYGNGASLCKDLFLRSAVQNSKIIRAFVTIEASHIVEGDDSNDIKSALGQLAVNMECCSTSPRGSNLVYRRERLGCTSLSLGLPAGVTEVVNVAASAHLALAPVFNYLALAYTDAGGSVSDLFSQSMARENRLDSVSAQVRMNPQAEIAPTPISKVGGGTAEPSTPPPAAPGFFGRMFGSSTKVQSSGKFPVVANGKVGGGSASVSEHDDAHLTVTDFDLLKIVGKGAFGKVMLVRKKSNTGEGQIYAMKVLKKSVVAAKGQIEHTKSERAILCEIRHPYIGSLFIYFLQIFCSLINYVFQLFSIHPDTVRLRFSFQSDDKLYLVTDYYNGVRK